MTDLERLQLLADSLATVTNTLNGIVPPAPATPAPLDFTAVDAAMGALNLAVVELQARFQPA